MRQAGLIQDGQRASTKPVWSLVQKSFSLEDAHKNHDCCIIGIMS